MKYLPSDEDFTIKTVLVQNSLAEKWMQKQELQSMVFLKLMHKMRRRECTMSMKADERGDKMLEAA